MKFLLWIFIGNLFPQFETKHSKQDICNKGCGRTVWVLQRDVHFIFEVRRFVNLNLGYEKNQFNVAWLISLILFNLTAKTFPLMTICFSSSD